MPEDLLDRTKRFSHQILDLCESAPTNRTAGVLTHQLMRSGTSVGAHYREVQHARSDAEFTSKIESGLQELNESIYWIELLKERHLVDQDEALALLDEANQLTAIFITIVKKAKARSN